MMYTDPFVLPTYHIIKVKLLVNVATTPLVLVHPPLDRNRGYQKEGVFENNYLQPKIK